MGAPATKSDSHDTNGEADTKPRGWGRNQIAERDVRWPLNTGASSRERSERLTRHSAAVAKRLRHRAPPSRGRINGSGPSAGRRDWGGRDQPGMAPNLEAADPPPSPASPAQISGSSAPLGSWALHPPPCAPAPNHSSPGSGTFYPCQALIDQIQHFSHFHKQQEGPLELLAPSPCMEKENGPRIGKSLLKAAQEAFLPCPGPRSLPNSGFIAETPESCPLTSMCVLWYPPTYQ